MTQNKDRMSRHMMNVTTQISDLQAALPIFDTDDRTSVGLISLAVSFTDDPDNPLQPRTEFALLSNIIDPALVITVLENAMRIFIERVESGADITQGPTTERYN